jgi:ATP-dependent RNA helicase HelY
LRASERRGDGIRANGRTLRRIYGERDLLVAECLRRGASGTISILAGFAAMAAALVYEPRRDEGFQTFGPLPAEGRLSGLEERTDLWSKLDDIERDHKLPGSNRCPPACHSR